MKSFKIRDFLFASYLLTNTKNNNVSGGNCGSAADSGGAACCFYGGELKGSEADLGYGRNSVLGELFSCSAMIELLLPMLIYGIFLLCIASVKRKPSQRQVLAIIFVILAVLFELVTGLVLAPFNLMLQARLGGALEFASYSALNSAISQITPLFTVAAFALFCMAAGSCLPVTAEPAAHFAGDM